MTDTRRPGVCGSDSFSVFFSLLLLSASYFESLWVQLFFVFCFSLYFAKYSL